MLESSFSITLILFSALAALLNWNRDFAKHKLNIRTCLHLFTYFFSLPIFLFSRPFLLQIVSCRVHSHFIHTKKWVWNVFSHITKAPFHDYLIIIFCLVIELCTRLNTFGFTYFNVKYRFWERFVSNCNNQFHCIIV